MYFNKLFNESTTVYFSGIMTLIGSGIGALIAGMYTLNSVNKTIEEQRRNEYLKKEPKFEFDVKNYFDKLIPDIDQDKAGRGALSGKMITSDVILELYNVGDVALDVQVKYDLKTISEEYFELTEVEKGKTILYEAQKIKIYARNNYQSIEYEILSSDAKLGLIKDIFHLPLPQYYMELIYAYLRAYEKKPVEIIQNASCIPDLRLIFEYNDRINRYYKEEYKVNFTFISVPNKENSGSNKFDYQFYIEKV